MGARTLSYVAAYDFVRRSDVTNIYRPQQKLRKGYVFTCVCLSTGGIMRGRGHAWREFGGVCVTGETATAADGTHPTGMHSC